MMDTRQEIGLKLARREQDRLCREHPLEQLFWECTLRCNLSCRHCGSDCSKDLRATEMPLSDFLPVLDEIARHQDPAGVLVSTVGGEPLVRRDIVDCGREIKRRGFMWGMVTNGYLLDKPMMDSLAEAGIDCLSVDVDGPADAHNHLRNNPHSFERAMRAVELMKAVDGLSWDVISCIHPACVDRLEELKQLLIDAGVEHWRCFTIVPMGRAAAGENLQLTDAQFRDLLNFIVKTRREGKIDMSYACEGFLGAYEGLVRDDFYRCEAGLTVASVRHDGAISGCLSIRGEYSQGNIYTHNFWDVWDREFDIYRNREWMRRGRCAHCEVFDYCRGNGFHLRDSNGEVMTCHYNRLKNVKL